MAETAIQEGVNGLLVKDPRSGEELAEALKTLLNDDARALFSNRAPDTVRSFQWPVVLKDYERVLKECSGHSSC